MVRAAAKLKKLMLRFYPPGLILQYEAVGGFPKQKPIDLLDLSPDTDLEVMVTQILSQEPLLGESKRPLLQQALQRVVDKQLEPQASQFELTKVYMCVLDLSITAWCCNWGVSADNPATCRSSCRCCAHTCCP
jgi:hypothetical protein